jgi:hypothetical protein
MRELDLFRERIRSFVNRSNGQTDEGEVSGLPSSSLEAAILSGRAYQHVERGPDGTLVPWSPQNPDGSFKYLPGMDGPVREG